MNLAVNKDFTASSFDLDDWMSFDGPCGTRTIAFSLTVYLTGSEFIMNISSFKLSLIGFTAALVLLTFSKQVLPKVEAHEGNEGCSVASLNGHYGQVLRGEVLGVGPIVAVGVTTFDGKGHFSAEQTINSNGNVFSAPLTGTYTVNPNCTGIADAVGTGLHSFVIVDGGKQMDLMDNNNTEVLTIHFTKIASGHED